jgi:hypothetical protein
MRKAMRLGAPAAVLGCAVAMLLLAACTGEAQKEVPKPIPAGKGINLTPYAIVTASSSHFSGNYNAYNVKTEGTPWATDARGRDQNIGAWIQLAWDSPVVVHQVELQDRPGGMDHVAEGHLVFSDNGPTVTSGELPVDESTLKVDFDARDVTWVRFVIDKVGPNTACAGLRKFRVFGEKSETP